MRGLSFSPVAGLAPRPVTVKVGGERFEIRPALADVWLEAWAHHGVDGVLHAMLESSSDRYRYYRSMSRSPEAAERVLKASRLVFAKGAGMEDWWVADRLAIRSVGWAGVGGELIAQGLRPREVTFTVWLAATYRVLMASCEKDKRAALEDSLLLPPDGYDAEELPQDVSEFLTP